MLVYVLYTIYEYIDMNCQATTQTNSAKHYPNHWGQII